MCDEDRSRGPNQSYAFPTPPRQYGNGGVFFLGAGILTQIANPSYSAYLLYWTAGAATDTFIGGAWRGMNEYLLCARALTDSLP